MPTPGITRHPDGITAVDAAYGKPGQAAVHVVETAGRGVIVDAGTKHSVRHVHAALAELGIPREAIDYLFLTHVHLDHAGGAGVLMESLPNAVAVVHPRAASHLVQPDRLVAASIETFGAEDFARLYGDVRPIPAGRIRTTEDGEGLDWQGRVFRFLHTPGHAMHHHAIVDADCRNIFTGDTFGISYRETDSGRGAFIFPTTTPTQFDPEQLVGSVRRLAALRPEALYLTHYSRVSGVPVLADAMEHAVRECARIAKRHVSSRDPRPAIREELGQLLLDLAHEHETRLTDAELIDLFGPDLELNTDGLLAWLRRVR